jgi:hypothetical protein
MCYAKSRIRNELANWESGFRARYRLIQSLSISTTIVTPEQGYLTTTVSVSTLVGPSVWSPTSSGVWTFRTRSR